MRQRFQDLDRFTPADIEEALARNDPSELPLVPITAALISPDLRPALSVCVRLASHAEPRVRGNAVTAIGHLARRFRTLDEPSVRPVLEAALRDDDGSVRRAAALAADEVHQFLHWTLAGHTYG